MWGYLGGAHSATGEDFRRAKQLIGTSAGSIVAARLAGGEDPRRGEERVRWDGEVEPDQRPGTLRSALERASRVSLGAFSPLAAPALTAATPGGALARAARPGAGPERAHRARRPALAGRARSACASTAGCASWRWTAARVAAWCSATTARRRRASRTPWPPRARCRGCSRRSRSADREYVDGGVWSPTNLDLARAGRGDRVLCLVPTAAMGTGPSLALRGLATGWRLATSVEAAAARRRGASVEIVAPDTGAAQRHRAGPDEPRPPRQGAGRGLQAGHGPRRLALAQRGQPDHRAERGRVVQVRHRARPAPARRGTRRAAPSPP